MQFDVVCRWEIQFAHCIPFKLWQKASYVEIARRTEWNHNKLGGECGKGHGKGLVASGCKVSIVGESEIDRQAQAPLFHRLDKINFSRCVNILKQELLTGWQGDGVPRGEWGGEWSGVTGDWQLAMWLCWPWLCCAAAVCTTPLPSPLFTPLLSYLSPLLSISGSSGSYRPLRWKSENTIKAWKLFIQPVGRKPQKSEYTQLQRSLFHGNLWRLS